MAAIQSMTRRETILTPVLLLKLFLVPALIYLVTAIGRRWGPDVAGWCSALPIVAGPILLTMALEQGTGFAATAAGHTLLAVVAILVFSIAYAWASGRLGIGAAMTVALLAWAASVAALQHVALAPLPGFVLVVCLLALAPSLFPDIGAGAAPAATRPGGDLAPRMLAGAVLSLCVSLGAAAMGARLSGFLAMFPVMSTILTGFSHRACGRAFAVTLLRGMVRGYYAFAAFCLVLSLGLREGALASSFCSAALAALAVQWLTRRRPAALARRA